jgi:hypothetical protein
MDWPITTSFAEHEATVPSRILWIVFDYFAVQNHSANFGCSDLDGWPSHLADSMRKEEYALLR